MRPRNIHPIFSHFKNRPLGLDNLRNGHFSSLDYLNFHPSLILFLYLQEVNTRLVRISETTAPFSATNNSRKEIKNYFQR